MRKKTSNFFYALLVLLFFAKPSIAQELSPVEVGITKSIVSTCTTGALPLVWLDQSCGGGAGPGGGGHIISEETTPLAQEANLRFLGSTITCVDNPGASATDCTIAAQTPLTDSASLAAALSNETGSAGGGLAVFNQSPTIVTPTIASFVNAAHNHTNAAGGGQITDAALSAAVGLTKGGTGATDAATARTNLGLAIGTNVQAFDAELTAFASCVSAADTLCYFTGAGTATTTPLTSFARTLLDDVNAAAARATLGITGLVTAIDVTNTPAGNIASVNVQAALNELDTEKQPINAELTALANNSTPGFWAAATAAPRTIVGVSGEVVVTNGAGIAGNPALGAGADMIKRNQANTYSGGGLQDFTTNLIRLPNSAGDPTATTGNVKVDTTANALKVVVNGVVRTALLNGDPVSTAIALAANGTNGTLATADFALGVDASGNAETGKVARSGSSAPAITPDFDGQPYQDTRVYNCSTGAGLPYMAKGGNFISIASVQDGYVTFTDGVNSASPCGADTFKFEASANIAPTVTSGSPDKVVHKIVVGSEARGDLMVRGASDWGRFAPGSFGDCFKSGGPAADPTWGGCSTAGVKSYWEADAIIQDETNCTVPTTVTINSGPTTRAFVCADSNSSVFQGKLQLPSAITTAVFTLTVSDVDSSSQVFAVNVDAMCRNTTTTINNTWGTAQSIAITMVTANVLYTGASAAVTPNGTCGAGATLFWRATVLGTTTNTDNGNARILSMFMAGS